jgi:uncharacterized membrane protein YsdA (DUF1294 family)/cold shock CspA family protein
MRLSGTITEWNDDRGFGFITPAAGTERVFIHVSAVTAGQARPANGNAVTFRLTRDERGRLRAEEVQFAAALEGVRGDVRAAGVAAALVIVGVAAAAVFRAAPVWVPAAYLLMSAATMAVYRMDKSAAQAARRRTPESTLHALELLGGWPGALIAQRLFRHKCTKVEYQVTFWIIVAAHIGLWAWWLATTGGRQ